MNTQNNYEYHKLLKFLYFEGYADSYEEAQYVLEELNCDGVLEYLIDEGYSDTFEDAVVIMANMSEEWRQSIVEANAGPSTPVKFDPKMGVVPNLGAGRVKNVRPKGTAALPGV
jgi:hypothetical protein